MNTNQKGLLAELKVHKALEVGAVICKPVGELVSGFLATQGAGWQQARP